MSIAKKTLTFLAILILVGILWFVIDQTIKVINKSNEKKNGKILKDGLEGRSGLNGFISPFSFNSNQVEYNFTDFESHENYHFFNHKECGPIFIGRRIEGGENASLLEFPWMVTLFAKSDSALLFFCGGSLISESLILTASHCVQSHVQGLKIIVRLGEYDMDTNPDCHYDGPKLLSCEEKVQDFYPNEYSIVIHNYYDEKTSYNDIALIKLKKPANLKQKNIKTVCLPFNEPDVASKLIVIGFGQHENSSKDRGTSRLMMKGSVSLLTNENCTKQYENALKSRPLLKQQFCAAEIKNKKYVDSCRGDSGGPIVGFPQKIIVRTKRNLNGEDYKDYPDDELSHDDKVDQSMRYVQHGIVSFGERKICGDGKRPGVYTKVYSHLKWILDNANPII